MSLPLTASRLLSCIQGEHAIAHCHPIAEANKSLRFAGRNPMTCDEESYGLRCEILWLAMRNPMACRTNALWLARLISYDFVFLMTRSTDASQKLAERIRFICLQISRITECCLTGYCIIAQMGFHNENIVQYLLLHRFFPQKDLLIRNNSVNLPPITKRQQYWLYK